MAPGRTVKVKAFPELKYSIYFLNNRKRNTIITTCLFISIFLKCILSGISNEITFKTIQRLLRHNKSSA